MRNFKPPAIPQTTSKSVRFPIDLIEQIEKEAGKSGATFSAFVIEAVRLALADLNGGKE